MNFLLLALKYLPHVLAAVTTVEQIAAGSPGVSKKQIVLNSITAVAQIAGQVDEKHVQVISQLIDSTVSQLNATGVFGQPKPKAL